MKQAWHLLCFLFVLTALPAAAAFAQTPPSELEGSYVALDHANELRWHAPDVDPAPASYNVYRKLDGAPSFELFASAGDRKYDDDSITIGLAYQYRVTAVYSGGAESSPTNTVTVTAGADSAGQGGTGSLPPRALTGFFDDRGAVELGWSAPDSMQQPLLYRVYRNGNGDPAFTLIGTAPELEFDDSLVAAHATYGYYVTALYAGDVESIPSNTVEIVTDSSADSSGDDGGGGSGNNAIAITSVPGIVAPIHQPYSYQPLVATEPAGQTVCFELHHAPAGMTMDPLTGALAWTPDALGAFEVELRVRICSSSGDGDAEQKFTLMVMSGTPGSLSGHVTDEASHPAPRIRMKIYDATNGAFILKTRTDSAGFYQFPTVNPGTYFVRADADSDRFEDVWYVNAKRLADATGVPVAEGGSATADFVLRAAAEDSSGPISVSGEVRDSSGAPLAGVRVSAFHAARRDSTSDDLFNDDHHHGSGEDVDFEAVTDSSGAYHLNLNAGTYTFRAKAAGFFEQYWSGRSTVLEADLLTLAGDTAGIDFHLIPGTAFMTGSGAISGTIRSAFDSTALRSHVMGFQKNFVGQFTGFVASVRSDSDGHYSLDSLPSGFYIVLAKHEDDFIPAFYTPAGGTAYLDSAALVFVDGAPVSGADIYLAGDSADGLNEIEGEVETESENEHPGKTVVRVPNAVVPLPGTIVVATAADGSVAGSTITDVSGSYSIPGLAAGEYTVTFQKPGSVSMQAGAALAYVNNAPGTSGVNALLASAQAPQAGLMGVHTAWNLVSVPVSAPDLSTAALFPSATSTAFRFAGSYQQSALLEAGSGYWVKFPANEVLTIPGAEILSQTIQLAKGWNLVGSLSYPVSAASVQTSPAGILTTDFFAYGGGYSSASLIEPGRGYWVKASEAGTMTMDVSSGGSFSAAAAPTRFIAPDVTAVTIADDAGNAQTLFVGTSSAAVSSELPPAPPSGAFDVRFNSNRLVELIDAGRQGAQEYLLTIRSAGRPVTVSWSVREDGYTYRLVNDRGATVSSARLGAAALKTGAVTQLTLVAEPTSLPKAFALEQNYPNPFNPTTSIRFDLPAAGIVSMRVYNLIGQEVAALLENREMEAGAHTVEFDASRLASGVYLYRLDAVAAGSSPAPFSEVRKMVLVK